MELTLICPKCGKMKDKGEFIDNLCSECYLEDKNIVSLKNNQITLCKACARLKNKGRFEQISEDDIERILLDNIKINLDNVKIIGTQTTFFKDKLELDIKFSGEIEGKKMVKEEKVVVHIKSQICEDCYKTLADFYMAKIQVRYDEEMKEAYEKHFKTKISTFFVKKMKSIIKEQRKSGDFLAYIYKIENTKNGFDMYLGSKHQAVSFLKQMRDFVNYERKDSKTLIGVDKQGKRKLRYTYLLRLK